MKKILGDSIDVKIIEYLDLPIPFTLCYIEGLINKQQIEHSIIEPIKKWQNQNGKAVLKSEGLIHQTEISTTVHTI
jgi:spore germination protein KA